MCNSKTIAVALAAACVLPARAQAQDSAVLEEIRREIQQLRQSYEAQIQALEQRLKAAETEAANAKAAAAKAEDTAQKAEASAQASAAKAEDSAQRAQAPAAVSANAFNPGISLILNGSYNYYGQDPADVGVTGYVPAGERPIGPRGFSLNESELTLSAAVDQLFYGQATFAVEQEEGEFALEVEEAYIKTPALGHGLTIKGGQFFSGLGYANEQHPHAWDFFDAALPNQTFLDNNLAVVGVQGTWVAPLPVLLELGAEGDNPVGFPFADSGSTGNQIPSYTLFARLGGDIGTSSSYRVGAWWLAAQNGLSSPSPLLDFDDFYSIQDGDTKLWGLDFVFKWSPNGNPTERNLKLQAEWMQRRIDGDLTYDDTVNPALTGPVKVTQDGWYAQGVYQFMPRWRAGLRYDRLSNGSFSVDPALAGVVAAPGYAPYRWSTMVDWSTSEFSRIRLQYNYDKTQQDLTNNEVFLQYIMSLGTHGAHKF
jgi:hypothetical protein